VSRRLFEQFAAAVEQAAVSGAAPQASPARPGALRLLASAVTGRLRAFLRRWRHVLTGVVDWSGGAVGPPGFDVSWCRLDLYLLHGEHIADDFLHAYEAASGSVLPDRWLWDLWAVARSHRAVEAWVPNYRDLGRGDLTATELRNRHTAWTNRLLARSS
jgi:hypothetical protein